MRSNKTEGEYKYIETWALVGRPVVLKKDLKMNAIKGSYSFFRKYISLAFNCSFINQIWPQLKWPCLWKQNIGIRQLHESGVSMTTSTTWLRRDQGNCAQLEKENVLWNKKLEKKNFLFALIICYFLSLLRSRCKPPKETIVMHKKPIFITSFSN